MPDTDITYLSKQSDGSSFRKDSYVSDIAL